jgi:hypothetical protein
LQDLLQHLCTHTNTQALLDARFRLLQPSIIPTAMFCASYTLLWTPHRRITM